MFNALRRIMRGAPLLVLILFIWFVLTILSLVGRRGVYSEYSTKHGRLPGLSLVMQGIHDHVYPWSPAGSAKGQGDDADESEDGKKAKPGDGSEAGAPDTEPAARDGAGKDEIGKLQTGETEPKAVDFKVPESSCSKVVPAKDYGVAEESYLSPEDTVYNTDKEGLFAPNGTYYSLQEVDDKYFADALMIGDSRTVGLYEYGDMEEVTSFLARESASIYDLFDDDEKMEYTPIGKDSDERTLKDLLSKTKFKKIYISVGVNELGVPDTEDYYKEFRKVVAKINKMQPDAIIYIQGIMHVSKAMSSTDPVYNNKAIVQRNKAIATLANGRNIFYIDMNADLCDEDGNLKSDLSGDGIHLKASACELWHQFLRKNAIVLPGTEKETPAEETPEKEAPAEETPAQEAAAGQA